MNDNAWYNRGELPPVGTMCEFIGITRGKKGTIVCHVTAGYGQQLAVIQYERNGFDYGGADRFRPIQTDRERTIEAAKKYLKDNGGFYSDEVVKLLYDAEMLRLPEGE